MKRTIILPVLTIILIATMLIGGCGKSTNNDTGDKDKTDNPAVTATPMPSVSPEPEDEDKYRISGKDLDPEVVAAFKEYICAHTVSMGRFLMDEYYYYDVTGDGKPDLIKSVTHGSGIVSTGIFVYDIENRQGYQLQERGDYDYFVDSVKDGVLYIKKAYFGRMKMDAGAVGKLEFVDGELRYNGPEPDRSDLPTPVVTRKPTDAVTEIPIPVVTEPPKYTDVEITGEYYKFHLPSQLLDRYNDISIEENGDDGVVIYDAYSIPRIEYMRLSVVTDIDDAAALVEDKTQESISVFSKDHIFVWQIPVDSGYIGYYDLYDMAKEMVVLKDGETNEAIESFTTDHFKRFIELTKNDQYPWKSLYSYGIEILGGAELSDMSVYTLIDTKYAPTNRLIIKDGDEIYFTEHFEDGKVERLTSMYSFDYDNNGIKEYGIIPRFTDPVDGHICNEYDHLWVAEKTKGTSEYSVFDFDAIMNSSASVPWYSKSSFTASKRLTVMIFVL